jgi:predicted amidohydrolase
MLVTEDVARNETTILRGIELAAEQGAQFLLTPEGALSGYHAGFDGKEVARSTERVADRAHQNGLGLLLGTYYQEVHGTTEHCYNQVRAYAPDGAFLGFYAKILRCSSLSHPGTGEMSHYVEGVPRVFHWNGMCFGVLTCNDLWATPGYTTLSNPYLPWRLSQMGAEVIFHAISPGHHQRYRSFHESSVRLWAHALQIPTLEVNALTSPEEPVNASSGLVSPAGTYSPDVPDVGERFFTCELPLRRGSANGISNAASAPRAVPEPSAVRD